MLFGRHRADLRRFIELRLDARLRARLDASDVVQETQLEVFRRLPDYLERAPMPFRLWLRKTAYEQLVTARRRHLSAGRRAAGREVAFPDRSSLLLAQRLAAGRSTPSQQVHRRELIRRVRQALNQLSAEDRELLLMRNYEDLSYEEIGMIVGIESAAARQRHGRALLRLHGVLGESGLKESHL